MVIELQSTANGDDDSMDTMLMDNGLSVVFDGNLAVVWLTRDAGDFGIGWRY